MVTGHTPTGTVGGPLSGFTVTFNEAIGSFPLDQVTITGPAGNAITPTSVTPSGDSRTWTVGFANQGLAGTYQFKVGPNVLDASVFGNAMNQDGDWLNGETNGQDTYSGSFTLGPPIPTLPPVVEGLELGDVVALGGSWAFVTTSGSTSVTTGNQHGGTYALQMVDGTNRYSSSYYQDAILHVNLLDMSDVVLEFWTKEYSGTSSDASVSISVNGTTWVTPTGGSIAGSSNYEHYLFALDSLGLTYSNDVQIKFHHNSYYAGGFVWDDIRVRSKPPTIERHTPSGYTAVAPGSIRFEFDEPMNTGSFAAADDVVSFTGPSGNNLLDQITGFSWVDSHTLQVSLSPQMEGGTYTLILGPGIQDLAGKSLDQDGDGIGGEPSDDRYIATFSTPQTIYAATMDADPGWTLDSGTAPYRWQYGQPTGQGANGRDPTSGYTGNNIIGYNLNGDYPNSLNPAQYAKTPAIDCSGYENVRLSFYRWLGLESATYDHATVQVSNNGTSWTTVWNHTGGTFCDTSWVYQEFDISAVADGHATVYVRWGMGTTDGSVVYPGWNIDDVSLTGQKRDLVMSNCEAPAAVLANQQIAVNRTYEVAWTGLTDNITIGYYLSSNAQFDGVPGDYLIGTETINNAADKAFGQHAGQSPAFSIPSDVPDGHYWLFARVDDGGAVSEFSETNNVLGDQIDIDRIPPRVIGTRLGFGSQLGLSQRSAVRTIEVTFSEGMNITLNDVSLINLGVSADADPDTPITIAPGNFSYNSTTHTATISFSSSLADGYYELKIKGSGVTDSVGNLLDGMSNHTPGSDYVYYFHRLAGDLNGDKVVNVLDVGRLKSGLGAPYDSEKDVNGDGAINVLDVGILKSQLGRRVIPPSGVGLAMTAAEGSMASVDPTDGTAISIAVVATPKVEGLSLASEQTFPATAPVVSAVDETADSRTDALTSVEPVVWSFRPSKLLTWSTRGTDGLSGSEIESLLKSAGIEDAIRYLDGQKAASGKALLAASEGPAVDLSAVGAVRLENLAVEFKASLGDSQTPLHSWASALLPENEGKIFGSLDGELETSIDRRPELLEA